MNRKEFELEVLQSDLCPNDFKEIYNEFRRYQDEAIRTLNEFHRVCEKNGIRYQLAFGSLLGAVRDNGQIPWDYDIDVIVPYIEKDKLIQVLRKDLDNNYYFHCPEQDEKCRHFMMRLAPKEYKTTLLHVDVFYMIGAPEDEIERSQFETEMQKCFHQRYRKLVKFNDLPNMKSKIKAFVYKMILLPITVNKITKNMKSVCGKFDFSKAKMCITVAGDYKNKAFETNKLWETMLIKTENGTFRITKNYDYVLKIIYGNYQKIFPLENRLNEMISHYNKITGKRIHLKNTKINARYYMDSKDLR